MWQYYLYEEQIPPLIPRICSLWQYFCYLEFPDWNNLLHDGIAGYIPDTESTHD
jgi:hypothetical protein